MNEYVMKILIGGVQIQYARVPRRGSSGGLSQRNSLGGTTGQWLKRTAPYTEYQAFTAIGHSRET